jgi:hypothetical protein
VLTLQPSFLQNLFRRFDNRQRLDHILLPLDEITNAFKFFNSRPRNAARTRHLIGSVTCQALLLLLVRALVLIHCSSAVVCVFFEIGRLVGRRTRWLASLVGCFSNCDFARGCSKVLPRFLCLLMAHLLPITLLSLLFPFLFTTSNVCFPQLAPLLALHSDFGGLTLLFSFSQVQLEMLPLYFADKPQNNLYFNPSFSLLHHISCSFSRLLGRLVKEALSSTFACHQPTFHPFLADQHKTKKMQKAFIIRSFAKRTFGTFSLTSDVRQFDSIFEIQTLMFQMPNIRLTSLSPFIEFRCFRLGSRRLFRSRHVVQVEFAFLIPLNFESKETIHSNVTLTFGRSLPINYFYDRHF